MIAALMALSLMAGDERLKLVVMPIAAQRIDAEVVKILDELLLTEVDRVGRYQILGASDLNALLGLEKMKNAMGCDDVTCAAEIGGALGAELLLAANAGILGDKLELSAKLIDTRASTVMQRSSASVPREESAYAQGLRDLVAALFGSTGAAATAAAVPAEHAAAVAASGMTYPDWQMLQRFGVAGLGRPEFDAWRASGLLYPQWARQHNDASESWLVEIIKWAASGAAVLFFVIELVEHSDPENDWNQHGYLTLTGVSAGAAVLTWGLDLAQIGDVPRELPE